MKPQPGNPDSGPPTGSACTRLDEVKRVNAEIVVAAMNLDLRACPPCIARYGADGLGAEADRLLAGATHRRPITPRCLHCGIPVLLHPNGSFNLWCDACEAERQKLLGAP